MKRQVSNSTDARAGCKSSILVLSFLCVTPKGRLGNRDDSGCGAASSYVDRSKVTVFQVVPGGAGSGRGPPTVQQCILF
jgi:hypothetical protein